MIPKKAVIFDLDQTLLDRITSLKRFLRWQINFFQLVSTMKKEFFIQRFLELDDNGKIWKDSVYQQLIHEFSIDHVTHDMLLASYINDFNKFSCCFKNVENTIIELKEQGYLIGLISNGRTPFQEHNFYALGLTEFFSSIIVSEAVGLRKPDPEIFLLGCKELGVCPQNCIFVGDNELADIQGAKAVRMKTIFFHPDPSIRSLIADATLHHYTKLIDLLKTI
ncbi:HAD family hydrolase [Acinetobacter courvalinii]|uniref:HAD family hydrolase n=1 Tax=Acinetobacter courvalinii TaxID=280147 RepID=UPI0004493F06|nr:HAD family hydrolase [Acinetobacter courvalinii]EXB27950.1 HAD hydrolase, IA, variant 1 family protein [Acinetobacter baumannii 1437282]MCU4369016.1 HAD family hydrolase [Acinetobacter courvalinii]MCU4447221.1 HAD family hydrolase [Acinetobacter courvalinii]